MCSLHLQTYLWRPTQMPKLEILFIPIHDSQTKLYAITSAVERHYHAKEPILLRVSTEAAAEYVDKLLWRMPACGVLPHRIVGKDCSDSIAIVIGNENWNRAKILFNLSPDAHPYYDQFERIYELLDQTSPEKNTLSQQRMQTYPHHAIWAAKQPAEA